MRRLTKIIISFVIVFGVCYGLIVKFYPSILVYLVSRPIKEAIEIPFPSHHTSLFLESISQGIDYKRRAISCSNDFEFDESDYVFETDMVVFVEVTNDTLKVYALDHAREPKVFNSEIVVKQIVLDNPAYMKLFTRSDLIKF